MILSLAADDAGFSADIPTDRQIDIIPRKRLSNRDFVRVAHCKASDTVDPEYLGFGHRLRLKWFLEQEYTVHDEVKWSIRLGFLPARAFRVLQVF
jgi:hypothetical protein